MACKTATILHHINDWSYCIWLYEAVCFYCFFVFFHSGLLKKTAWSLWGCMIRLNKKTEVRTERKRLKFQGTGFELTCQWKKALSNVSVKVRCNILLAGWAKHTLEAFQTFGAFSTSTCYSMHIVVLYKTIIQNPVWLVKGTSSLHGLPLLVFKIKTYGLLSPFRHTCLDVKSIASLYFHSRQLHGWINEYPAKHLIYSMWANRNELRPNSKLL